MNAALPRVSQPLDFSSFNQTIANARNAWQNRKTELQHLVDNRPLLLFGFGGKGQMLAHQIRQITGKEITVYDTSASKREAAQQQGFKTLVQFSQADNTRWATILGACQAQFEQKAAVGENFIFYQEAANLLGAPHLANLAKDFEAYIPAHLEALYKTYLALHPTSQPCFVQVLCFRISGDPTHLRAVRQANAEMWLNVPTAFKKRNYDTFLDVGAFDGDTLRFFHQRFGCQRGIAVEANESLFDSIRKVASLYPRGIDIMPKAAWSSITRLRFQEVRQGMIQVTESADGELDAAPIDTHVRESVDCLKMDIEGAESEALAGCKELLKNYKPDLAIAAYHRPEDFVDLFAQIVDLGYGSGDFTWHLGHYSDCVDDSIFYVLQSERVAIDSLAPAVASGEGERA